MMSIISGIGHISSSSHGRRATQGKICSTLSTDYDTSWTRRRGGGGCPNVLLCRTTWEPPIQDMISTLQPLRGKAATVSQGCLGAYSTSVHNWENVSPMRSALRPVPANGPSVCVHTQLIKCLVSWGAPSQALVHQWVMYTTHVHTEGGCTTNGY